MNRHSLLSIAAAALFACLPAKGDVNPIGDWSGWQNPARVVGVEEFTAPGNTNVLLGQVCVKNSSTDLGSPTSISIVPRMSEPGAITALRFYLRLFPQAGNPLRFDTTNGKLGDYATISNSNAADISLWDETDPMTAANQTVKYLGSVTEGIEDGVQLDVTFDDSFAAAAKEALATISSDSRHYICVVADINPNATVRPDASTRNSVGFKLVSYNGSTAIGDIANEYLRPLIKGTQMIASPCNGYSRNWRIPAITTLPNNRVLMTFDARKYHNHDVRNDVDVVSFSSDDQGKTWSKLVTVAQGTGMTDQSGSCANAMGNGDAAISPIDDQGGVLAIYIHGEPLSSASSSSYSTVRPDIRYAISHNYGDSWEEIGEIPQSAYYKPTGMVAVPGPGRLCRVTSGPLKGKIIAPVYTWPSPYTLQFLCYDPATGEWSNIGYFSYGSTTSWWDTTTYSFSDFTAISENHIVQISDTEFILTSRGNWGNPYYNRWFKLTLDENGNLPKITASSTTKTVASDSNVEVIGTNSFGSGVNVTTCVNSNMVVVERDGKKYLVQAIATKQADDKFGGTATARVDLYVNYADLSNIIGNNEGTLQWGTPTLISRAGKAWESKYNEIAGYSCLTEQSDGSLGIVSEFHTAAFSSTTSSYTGTHNSDALLAIKYYNLSWEDITHKEEYKPEVKRVLLNPVITPGSHAFNVIEGKISDANTVLPNFTITAPVEDMTLADDDTWYIEYKVSKNGQGATPKEYRENVADIEDSLDNYGDTFSMSDLKTDDVFVVTATFVVEDKAGNKYYSGTVTEAYTARNPVSTVTLVIEPGNSDCKASVNDPKDRTVLNVSGASKSFAVGHDLTILAEAGKLWKLVSITTDQGTMVDTTNPNQKTFKVPQSEGNITITVTFENELGGFRADGIVIYELVEVKKPFEFTFSGVTGNETKQLTEDYKDNYFDHDAPLSAEAVWNASKSARNTDYYPYPSQTVNEVDHLTLNKVNGTASNFTCNAKAVVRLTPDLYTHKKYAVISYWALGADGSYTCVEEAVEKIHGIDNTAPQGEHNWALNNTPYLSFDLGYMTLQERLTEGDNGKEIGRVVVNILSDIPTATKVKAVLAEEAARLAKLSQNRVSGASRDASASSYDYAVDFPVIYNAFNGVVTGIDSAVGGDAELSFTIDTSVEDQVTFEGEVADFEVVDLLGRVIYEGVLEGKHTIHLAPGVYIANNVKFVVR